MLFLKSIKNSDIKSSSGLTLSLSNEDQGLYACPAISDENKPFVLMVKKKIDQWYAWARLNDFNGVGPPSLQTRIKHLLGCFKDGGRHAHELLFKIKYVRHTAKYDLGDSIFAVYAEYACTI